MSPLMRLLPMSSFFFWSDINTFSDGDPQLACVSIGALCILDLGNCCSVMRL